MYLEYNGYFTIFVQIEELNGVVELKFFKPYEVSKKLSFFYCMRALL